MRSRRAIFLGFFIGSPAGVLAIRYALFGPKLLAVPAGIIIAASILSIPLARHRHRLFYLCVILLLVATLAVPYSEPLIRNIIALVGGHEEKLEPPIPIVTQAGSVSWNSAFSDGAVPVASEAGEWPGWRGFSTAGVAADSRPPDTWSETTNVVWRTAVPGRGYASPCVVADRIVLATADEDQFAQGLLCYHADDGRLLWAARLHSGTPIPIHLKNSHSSSTPCSDGRLVYAVFLADQDRHGIWASAVDLNGRTQWQTFVGKFHNLEGYAPSPVCRDGLLYVVADGLDESYLAALDCVTGELRWKVARDVGASYGGPVIAEVAGRKQLLVAGNGKLVSYDPVSGREVWRCGSLPQYCAGTPTWDKEFVYASGGAPEKVLIAVRADGTGDVTETHVRWRAMNNASYVPSPLLIDDDIFLATDSGVFVCVSTTTGRVKWKIRLAGSFSSSPSWADGRIYVANEEGAMFVLSPRRRELLATNMLTPGGMATPAFIGPRIYLRTHHFLYRLEDRSVGKAENGRPL